MAIYPKVNGEHKEMTNGKVKVGGAWKQIADIFAKQSGAWVNVWEDGALARNVFYEWTANATYTDYYTDMTYNGVIFNNLIITCYDKNGDVVRTYHYDNKQWNSLDQTLSDASGTTIGNLRISVDLAKKSITYYASLGANLSKVTISIGKILTNV